MQVPPEASLVVVAHGPDHPVKVVFVSVVDADRVTEVGGVVFGTSMLQPAVDPLLQVIPALPPMPGAVTFPFPDPNIWAVSLNWLGWNVA